MSRDDEGPLDNDARPEETEIESPEPTEEADTEFHPFEELEEDFRPMPARHVMGADGLPVQVDETTASDIPALSPKTLVCMGDFTKFVIRNRWGLVLGTFAADEVTRTPDGSWSVAVTCALERTELALEQSRKRLSEIQDKLGRSFVGPVGSAEDLSPLTLLMSILAPPGSEQVSVRDLERIEVEPIRPPCKHYVRQMTSWNLNAERRAIMRLCAARRTTEGTFMTVRDTGMWACDMREPYDVESVKQLDDFDALKVEQGANRTYLPIFRDLGIFEQPAEKEGN